MIVLNNCILIYCLLQLKPTITMNSTECEENQLIVGERSDGIISIDVPLNEMLNLKCQFCDVSYEPEAYLWHQTDMWNVVSREVMYDGKNNDINRKIVQVDRTLTINKITLMDNGNYVCMRADDEYQQRIAYIVNVEFNDQILGQRGNLLDWSKYHAKYIEPFNKVLNGTEYSFMKVILNIQLEVFTDWDTEWRNCEDCDKKIQEKTGYCRIKILTSQKSNISIANASTIMQYFINLDKVSCYSILLSNLFPNVSNSTRQIPHFVLLRNCTENCLTGHKKRKTKKFKYRKLFLLEENSHLSLVCPESSINKDVTWQKNGRLIKTDKNGDLRILIDIFNILHLLQVTAEEEGNYTCKVDDQYVLQALVIIVSKFTLRAKAILKHMMYLIFFMSFTFVLYCVICAVTWRKSKH